MRDFFLRLATVLLATGLAMLARWVHDRLLPPRAPIHGPYYPSQSPHFHTYQQA